MISVSFSRARWLSPSASRLGLQFAIIGQLAVEAEAEPFVLLQMVPLERLGVTAVFGAAGGIAHVADGRPAGVLLHQAFVLAAMVHAENFADAAHVFVRVQQLLAVGVERGHAGRKLAAVLNVQQHPRHQPRNFVGPLLRAQAGCCAAPGK